MRALLSIAPVSIPGRRRIIPLLVALTLTALYIHSWAFARVPYSGPAKLPTQATLDVHPITQLISNATAHFETLLRERSFTLEDAAEKYRQRRGQHPPPGFNA
ncbi:hypothetical protein LLEC1_04197 [Akanthomyces lecanii]|uniref:Uncharacterized protein n=1 Tax=Cordyceps confragosa TaxID=2714763 RepID=A0A179IHS5_CORDF|nr:hypothetical protein LLEC1_04197 [Akanthomyces lecanii]